MVNEWNETQLIKERKKDRLTFMDYLISKKVVPEHYRDWKEQDDIHDWWEMNIINEMKLKRFLNEEDDHISPSKQYQDALNG